MNKIKLSTLLIGLLSLTALAGCNPSGESTSSISSSDGSSTTSTPSDIYIEEVTLSKTETNILIGSSEKLTATFKPSNATKAELVWSSDDTSVATVDQTGLVTAKKVGTTNIKVAPKDNNSNIAPAACKVTVRDNVVLSSVSLKHEFVLFEQNRAKDDKNDDGFYDHAQTYKVGDDNKFNVKPALTVLDATTYQPVNASRWLYDFTISAKLGDQVVGEEYFKVLDARECDVKFTEAAVGKTFTISVAPGGVDASRVASLTKSFTVDVVDGYNVYNAKELGYFDTRPQNTTVDGADIEDDKVWECKWEEFKTANGMDANYHPASLLFQTDITVKPEDLPANFFYTKAQATALNDAKAEGSLYDYIYLYERSIPGSVTVDGNYFDLDFSEIPLITRERARPTAVGAVVGHSAAFKAIDGEDVTFRNINMTGNAKNAVGDGDKIFGGGIMFVKGSGSKTLRAENIIATKFFITFFGEDPYYDDHPFTKFDLEKVKCFNNYNSFMYNWGSQITASNSLFRSCGGPVIIQDHTHTDDYESQDGLTVYGNAPTTTFVDCTIKNYVTGQEAWFQQFGATSVTSDIKMLSDLFYATGLPKSFVTNEKGEGKLYQALAAANQSAYFNFIVLNKSGDAQGITAYPACGTVNIVNTNKTTTFNYRQPLYDDIYQTYLAYSAATDAGEQQALVMELVSKLTAKGYSFEADLSDLETEFRAYMAEVCTKHGMMRAVNSAGAPIIDFGEEFPLLMYDGKKDEHPFLQDMLTYLTGTYERYTPSAELLAKLPDYFALYYSGMALVMELTPYVA